MDQHDWSAETDHRLEGPRVRFEAARVIEIPRPRWTAYDVKRYGIKPLPGTQMTVTGRAYTSPIWYTPAAR